MSCKDEGLSHLLPSTHPEEDSFLDIFKELQSSEELKTPEKPFQKSKNLDAQPCQETSFSVKKESSKKTEGGFFEEACVKISEEPYAKIQEKLIPEQEIVQTSPDFLEDSPIPKSFQKEIDLDILFQNIYIQYIDVKDNKLKIKNEEEPRNPSSFEFTPVVPLGKKQLLHVEKHNVIETSDFRPLKASSFPEEVRFPLATTPPLLGENLHLTLMRVHASFKENTSEAISFSHQSGENSQRSLTSQNIPKAMPSLASQDTSLDFLKTMLVDMKFRHFSKKPIEMSFQHEDHGEVTLCVHMDSKKHVTAILGTGSEELASLLHKNKKSLLRIFDDHNYTVENIKINNGAL